VGGEQALGRSRPLRLWPASSGGLCYQRRSRSLLAWSFNSFWWAVSQLPCACSSAVLGPGCGAAARRRAAHRRTSHTPFPPAPPCLARRRGCRAWRCTSPTSSSSAGRCGSGGQTARRSAWYVLMQVTFDNARAGSSLCWARCCVIPCRTLTPHQATPCTPPPSRGAHSPRLALPYWPSQGCC